MVRVFKGFFHPNGKKIIQKIYRTYIFLGCAARDRADKYIEPIYIYRFFHPNGKKILSFFNFIDIII